MSGRNERFADAALSLDLLMAEADPAKNPLLSDCGEGAERIFRALMIDVYCRIDVLWDTASDEMYCLEANTLPGMTPTSLIPQMAAAEGMGYGELCEKIIAVSRKKYAE